MGRDGGGRRRGRRWAWRTLCYPQGRSVPPISAPASGLPRGATCLNTSGFRRRGCRGSETTSPDPGGSRRESRAEPCFPKGRGEEKKEKTATQLVAGWRRQRTSQGPGLQGPPKGASGDGVESPLSAYTQVLGPWGSRAPCGLTAAGVDALTLAAETCFPSELPGTSRST